LQAKVEIGFKFDEQLATSRLLFFAQLLETRIIPERIEHWIEPEQRRSKQHAVSEWARMRYREQFL
jgi:hypothetical protein